MNDGWRVGVLYSRSGVTAAVETSQHNGTMLAIEEINAAGGVLGRPLVPVVKDPASNPRLYGQLAAHLFRDAGVRSIFGCYMSSTRKAVMPELDAHRGLLFYATLYEGFEYHPRIIYTGAAPNQNAMQLARYILENYGHRFLFVGSNYLFPYESNRVMADLVRQVKGRVVEEIYVPLDCRRQDFDRVVREIRKHEPDVIFSTVVGSATAMFYSAYHEAGFDPAKMPIASLTTSEAEIAEMAPGVATGHLTAAPFFEGLDTPAARAFVSTFKARFGPQAAVTACAEAAYFQVMLYAEALRRAGGDDPDLIVSHLLGLEYDAPQGRIRIDPDNHHTELWPRVGRVDASDRFEVVWNPGVRLKPEPYFVEPTLDEWTFARLRMKKQDLRSEP
ncbi:MAG: transporter substrate-binding domain-containing protein [Phyllobacteriaceae bacterium]|nr:transporter substrate-binding domain-containing protein [Phyllobacteriaceae bacterium]